MARADAIGSNIVLVHFKQGAMPHELFVRNLQRFGEEVLPALKVHEVPHVPIA